MYKIIRSGTTFSGNLDLGDVVSILSIDNKVAHITNGYIQDYIMVKDLEKIKD